jgi:hypothetical protein
MADVLPSSIGMEGLLYLLFSGFVQANKSHEIPGFQKISGMNILGKPGISFGSRTYRRKHGNCCSHNFFQLFK